jgi:predicted aspartyl protease
MRLALRHNLPFTTVTLSYGGRTIQIPDVLIDTGSASTIFATDAVAGIGISPASGDRLRFLRGVGGTESVFTRKVDRVTVGEATVHERTIEVGGMDYGFEINGILGMDFLVDTGAVIDLRTLDLSFPDTDVATSDRA